jgi:hypothetical protein
MSVPDIGNGGATPDPDQTNSSDLPLTSYSDGIKSKSRPPFPPAELPVSQARPLLLGTLTQLYETWYPDDGNPPYEHRECKIIVWCPLCGDTHVHSWNPAHGCEVARMRSGPCTQLGTDRPHYYIAPRPNDPGHVTPPGIAVRRRKRGISR